MDRLYDILKRNGIMESGEIDAYVKRFNGTVSASEVRSRIKRELSELGLYDVRVYKYEELRAAMDSKQWPEPRRTRLKDLMYNCNLLDGKVESPRFERREDTADELASKALREIAAEAHKEQLQSNVRAAAERIMRRAGIDAPKPGEKLKEAVVNDGLDKLIAREGCTDQLLSSARSHTNRRCTRQDCWKANC
jgi:hypothetical protein